jgi:hypothetical protein
MTGRRTGAAGSTAYPSARIDARTLHADSGPAAGSCA